MVFKILLRSWDDVQVAKQRYIKALNSANGRWQLKNASDAQFTVSESFTLGWFNILLRHLWPTVLEKELSETATKIIKVGLCPK